MIGRYMGFDVEVLAGVQEQTVAKTVKFIPNYTVVFFGDFLVVCDGEKQTFKPICLIRQVIACK